MCYDLSFGLSPVHRPNSKKEKMAHAILGFCETRWTGAILMPVFIRGSTYQSPAGPHPILIGRQPLRRFCFSTLTLVSLFLVRTLGWTLCIWSVGAWKPLLTWCFEWRAIHFLLTRLFRDRLVAKLQVFIFPPTHPLIDCTLTLITL